jgi:acetylornithine deacetylase/succinyl-diaminopimelate desuccinylase-like protein
MLRRGARTAAVLSGLLVTAAVALAPRPVAADELRDAVRQWRQANEPALLREFAAFLALPNLASDEAGIRRNADQAAALLARRGVATRLLESPGSPPAVYGELKVPGARRTLMVYAHYDGQPVDASAWATPPWTPTLRAGVLEDKAPVVDLAALAQPIGGEWRMYARSASDDKAPILVAAAALDALRHAKRAPSVNLKFFLEGEEEAGSEHLEAMLKAHRELLKADLWLLCDGPVHQSRRPQVYFGVRGVTGVDVTVYGPARALHSGHYGNWAPNPAVELARLIASLRDSDGRILIPGFGDDVRPLTAAEREALASVPPVEDELKGALQLGRTEGGSAPLAELILRPALNVRGLESGKVGAAAANAVPVEARASIDFRLVPDQTPAGVRTKLEGHLRALGYHVVSETPDAATRRAHPRLVKLEWGPGYPAARTALDQPAARALVRVLERASGAPLVHVPTLGGSVPMYLFGEVLGAPVVGLPIVNHDNNQHAANENVRVQNLWDGLEAFAAVFAGLDAAWSER